MPRIRVLQAVAGLDFSWAAGDVVELSGAEAKKWADGERAELVRGERVEIPEQAKPVEKATRKARAAQPEGDDA